MNRHDTFSLPSFDDQPIAGENDDAPESYWLVAWRRLVRQHKASRLAAALSYRTIFSIVPVAVVCIAVVRGIVHLGEAKKWMQDAVFASTTWKLMFQNFAGKSADIERGINNLMDNVWGVNLTDIGVAGGLLLIYAALALFMEIELAFNDVLGVKERRPWPRRVANYWTFVTLGPMLLFGALYGASQSMVWLEMHFSVPYLADFVAGWFMLLFLYMVMPYTRVRLVAAIIGSFTAAVLWVTAKWGFGMYVTMAMPYQQLYGSLGLIPLFMFWLYMNWWIVLFGLEVTGFRQSRMKP